MALVSGRPISFKMDLYNPLYVDRPTVEPELFASLRPVTYSRRIRQGRPGARRWQRETSDHSMAARRTTAAAPAGAGGFGGGAAAARRLDGRWDCARDRRTRSSEADRKQHANDLGRELAGGSSTGTVGNAATAGALGDFFQYVIDHPVTLPRQKSALLADRGQGHRGHAAVDLQRARAGQAPAAGPAVQEHLRGAPEPGSDHGLRGQRLRRATPACSTFNPTRSACSPTPSTWAPKSIPRPEPGAEDHLGEGGQGDRHHGHEGDRREDLQDRQPLADRPHALDRAPQPHQPAVQAGRYREAGRGHARGLPLPDAGQGRRDQDLHGEGRTRHHPDRRR